MNHRGTLRRAQAPRKNGAEWTVTLRPEFTVNPGIDLTANSCREIIATFLPSDLPSD
jgi:hypothetical protein